MSENEEVDDVASDAGEIKEEPLEEEAPEEIKRPRKRRLSPNKIKILIVVAIISIALIIVCLYVSHFSHCIQYFVS